MIKLHAFDYNDVHLDSGALKRQVDEARQYYGNIPNDSLLKTYRTRAGLPAPGDDMGGWYDFQHHPGGHLIGHLISGLARIYRNSGDEELLRKIKYLVHEFGATMREDGYFFNYPEREGYALDYYLYDKIAIGMLDAYRYAGNQEALAILSKMTDWVILNHPLKKIDFEWYTLPENLYECYEATGDDKYLELARKLTHTSWYEDLRNEVNVLPGKHAYSHVNCLCSASRIYEVSRDEQFLRTVEHAYGMIMKEQLYASGGYGPGEAFVVPGTDTLRDAFFGLGTFNKYNTNKHSEATCNSYALIKLSRYLMRFTGDPVCGDVMERSIFNSMLGTLSPVGNGITHYYDAYRPGALKTYFTEQNNETWPCCSGTYIQVMADYVKNIYFRDETGIYVNLFVASSVGWTQGDTPITLRQITDFPQEQEIVFALTMSRPEVFSFRWRVPRWATSGVEVRLNGSPLAVDAEPGSIATIDRIWSDRDRIEIRMPASFYTVSINDVHPDTRALMYGPLLLVGHTASDALPVSQEELLQSLVPVPGHALAFTTTSLEPNFVFRPYCSIQDLSTVYTTYFNFNCGTPSPVTMDDIHTAWLYSNGWERVYDRIYDQLKKVNDFVHRALEAGASAKIIFEGTAAKLIASRSPAHGRMTIRLDGYPTDKVSLYSPESLDRQVVWEKSDLSPGIHTLVITAEQPEDDRDIDIFAEIDALEILPIPIVRKSSPLS